MDLAGTIILLCSCAAGAGGQYGNPLNKYIRHYEGLSYDTDLLHQKHQRAKRAVSHEDQFLRLDFHAHGSHQNVLAYCSVSPQGHTPTYPLDVSSSALQL